MSVYGGTIQNYNYDAEKAITLEQFVDFVRESDNFVSSIFDNGLFSIMESEYALTASTEKSEQTKKSIIQKIKELFSKFVGFVKGAFEKLANNLQEVYNKTNFVDKFVSRYKNVVTWENVEKLTNSGWKGVPSEIFMVGTPAKLQDAVVGEIKNSKVEKYNFDTEFDKIINSKDTEEAESNYKKFSEKLKEMKDDAIEDDMKSMLLRKQIKSEDLNNKILKGEIKVDEEVLQKMIQQHYSNYFFTFQKNEYGRYYPQDRNIFESTKYMAENGQKLARDVKQTGKKILSVMKIENKESDLTNMKSFKKGGSNYNENDSNVNKINMLYYKAKYEYASVFIKASSLGIRNVVNVIKTQHKHAIKFYMTMVSAIKKYLPNVKASS